MNLCQFRLISLSLLLNCCAGLGVTASQLCQSQVQLPKAGNERFSFVLEKQKIACNKSIKESLDDEDEDDDANQTGNSEEEHDPNQPGVNCICCVIDSNMNFTHKRHWPTGNFKIYSFMKRAHLNSSFPNLYDSNHI